MISKKNFSSEQYQQVLEFLALIAWKTELQAKSHNSKALKLAINTVISAAGTFAFKPLEMSLMTDLRFCLEELVENTEKKEQFSELRDIREKAGEIIRLFTSLAEDREIQIFSNFVYRFAYRLSEVSGHAFAGLGKRVDASEAEMLLIIKDEFPI